MKCAKSDCHWSAITKTSPCCVCGQQVHHLCSNELCDKGDLSQSRKCVRKVFRADDSDSQGPTPSSTSEISCSSNPTVIDLREPELEEKPATVNSIPDNISHGPPANSTDPIWGLVHRFGNPVTYKNKEFTHICMVCLETKTWQRSLCRASHASNAKMHFVYAHKDHELAILELQRRQHRAERFMVDPPAEAKRPPAAKGSAQDEKPTKRQKTWWKAPVSQEQITGHIARWLIRDGLAHNLVTTEAFHDFLVGVTGDINVTIPSSKTYNDILDKHYDTFTKDTSDSFVEEFQELDETPFMTVEHDLWTNSSKNNIVGVSGSYINRHWRPVRLALLAEVKNDGHDSEGVAAVMDEQLKARYGVDIKKMVRFTISDTAPGARKISKAI